MLAELGTLFAARFSARSIFTMLRFYSFPVWTIVVVVIDVSVLGRVFGRVRVVRSYFCHLESFRYRCQCQ